jgi:PKD repeat protein
VSAGDIKIPKMTWGPTEITDPRLVQLFSYDTKIAEALEEELEWKGIAIGDTIIRVMPRGPGSKSKILKDHALCIGCIYYGGAFGSEMPAAQSPLTVGNFTFKAIPSDGSAPLATTFSWEGLPTDAEPFTCVLDPGDGTAPITISDCANTTSRQHTYTYTLTFATPSGQYRASLQVLEMPLVREVDVNVKWRFAATPTQGQAPLDVTFNWSGFDPESGAISCTLDFGDGSAVQTFSNCHSTRTATHRYTSKGSYVPSLTIKGASGETVKTALVTVTEEASCNGVADVTAWQGTISYSDSRDVANSDKHKIYDVTVDITTQLTEVSRSKTGVSFVDDNLGGLVRIESESHSHYPEHRFEGSTSASGAPVPYSSGGSDYFNRSRLYFNISLDDCRYRFYLFGRVKGTQTSSDGTTSEVAAAFPEIYGEFDITSLTMSGSVPFPMVAYSRLLEENPPTTYVLEYGGIKEIVGADNMGTITVSWNFTPASTSP